MTQLAPAPIPASSTSILIVDDQANNLRTLSELLHREGFTVRQALDGQTAIDTAAAIAPDLILLDIRMPVMDGYEVCVKLKANPSTYNIPVIFLSALDDVLDKTRAFSVGGVDYITKPFQIEEVLLRIQHQLMIQCQQKQLLTLNQQLNYLNANLERQVHARTLELEQALTFEQTLKRISDQVRDTLDQHQILQTVVVELAKTLECTCCDAVLYNPDRQTSTIRYQAIQPGQAVTQGQILYMADAPEIYDQLHQQYWFAFCQIRPIPLRNHSAILACPIFDHQVQQLGILGDLWIFKPTLANFNDREVRLVEQVANQCAIALRQAQLYEASQRQVRELERLNQLKDDFLSTISHELRSPLANMKMALQMLDLITQQGHGWIEPSTQPVTLTSKVIQYFEILKYECDRELQLVKDLLDLQHLEAGMHQAELSSVNLYEWLTSIIDTFQIRIQEQQQSLTLEIASEMPPIVVDLPSLSRVITELMTNACKYTPANGTITISSHLEAGSVCFSIANTGVEIAPEELSRLFDKFYRIPNNDPWRHGGTGLGLALIKKLIEQMGGSIEVTNQNHITCFTVCLPIRDRRQSIL